MDLFGELADPWTTILSAVVLLAAVVYAWKNALSPAWVFITRRVKKQETQVILETIAEGFRDADDIQEARRHWAILVDVAKFLEPNGKTLAEHFQDNDDAHEHLFAELGGINEKLDGFIVERVEGGRRHYDIAPGGD